MTGNHSRTITPSTYFVVEREPGEGYRVTSAEGLHATEWRGRALALLDLLGQPDPKGPSEDFRWIGPLAPTGEFVGVVVNVMSNGEARYRQAWFQIPKPGFIYTRTIGLAVAILLAGLVVGVLAERKFSANGAGLASGSPSVNVEMQKPDGTDTLTREAAHSPFSAKLNSEIASSAVLRAKMTDFLSQEGLVAGISKPVVDEKRSVKLIADLDTTPPPRESIRLSNIDVARLLKLFEALDELKASSKHFDPPQSR